MNNWKRTFAFIWTGQFFSLMTSAIVGYSTVFWLSLESRSASVISIAMIASLLPQAVIGLFAGAFIDRWDRKKVMISADMFVAFFSAILAIMFFQGNIKYEYVYIVLALRSIGNAFHTPAMQASVPLLAPEKELTRIAGFNQMIQSSTNLVGPALGALLISNVNMGYVLLLDTAGAIIASTSLLFVHIPNPKKSEKHEQPHIWQDIKDGFRVIYDTKGILHLFGISTIFTLVIMPIAMIFPLISIEYFSGGAYEISIVETFWGVGMILGGLLIGAIKRSYNEVIVNNATYIICGVVLFLMGILPESGFVFFVGLTAVCAVTAAVGYSVFTAITQKNIAPEALGRVFSLNYSFSILPSMVGLTFATVLVESIGLMLMLKVGGASIILIGTVAMFSKPMMEMGRISHSSLMREKYGSKN